MDDICTGLKYDEGKPPLSLIPRSAMLAEARVLAVGATKYGRYNWLGGMEWSRLIDATLRHVTAYSDGEDVDSETGESHLAHARCCLGFLIEYYEKGLGSDNRFKSQALALANASRAAQGRDDDLRYCAGRPSPVAQTPEGYAETGNRNSTITPGGPI